VVEYWFQSVWLPYVGHSSHSGQLSLAIPLWVEKISTVDGHNHGLERNGKVGPEPALLAY